MPIIAPTCTLQFHLCWLLQLYFFIVVPNAAYADAALSYLWLPETPCSLCYMTCHLLYLKECLFTHAAATWLTFKPQFLNPCCTSEFFFFNGEMPCFVFNYLESKQNPWNFSLGLCTVNYCMLKKYKTEIKQCVIYRKENKRL